MLAVPPAILELLGMRAGSSVGITVDRGRLVVEPQRTRHYKLEDLLAQCDPQAELTAEDHEWLDAKPVGNELL